MSTVMDGINNMQLYTAQIEQLRAMDPSANPTEVDAALYTIEKTFNEMLNSLTSTDDDDDTSNESDLFKFLVESNQQTLDNIRALQNKQP